MTSNRPMGLRSVMPKSRSPLTVVPVIPGTPGAGLWVSTRIELLMAGLKKVPRTAKRSVIGLGVMRSLSGLMGAPDQGSRSAWAGTVHDGRSGLSLRHLSRNLSSGL